VTSPADSTGYIQTLQTAGCIAAYLRRGLVLQAPGRFSLKAGVQGMYVEVRYNAVIPQVLKECCKYKAAESAQLCSGASDSHSLLFHAQRTVTCMTLFRFLYFLHSADLSMNTGISPLCLGSRLNQALAAACRAQAPYARSPTTHLSTFLGLPLS